MSKSATPHPELLGLIEMDQAGTILYSELEQAGTSADLNGRNFYAEIAPFKNIESLHYLIDAFTSGREQTKCFDFTCDFDAARVPMRVLLARVCERSDKTRTKSLLVHIRRL